MSWEKQIGREQLSECMQAKKALGPAYGNRDHRGSIQKCKEYFI